MKTTSKSLLLVLLSSLFAGAGQLLWKKVSLDLVLNFASLFNPFLILGALVYFLAIVFMTLAFREGELSILHPFLATSFIWVTLASSFLFESETLTFFKAAGVIIVFLGVSLVGIGREK